MTGSLDNSNRFPLVLTVIGLTVTALVVGGVSFGLARLILPGRTDAGLAVLVAILVAWLTSIVGLLPVVALGSRGVMATIVGYFAGAAVRLTVVLGACIVVLLTKVMSGDVFSLTLVGAYMPLLFIEAGVVGRFLWRMDDSTAAQAAGDVTEITA